MPGDGRRGRTNLAGRVAAYLRGRGAPAASHVLARLFLRAAAPTEEIATRLLRPSLAPAGLRYEEGAGWLPPAGRPEGPRAPRLVAAAVGRGAARPVLVEAREEGAADAAAEDLALGEATLVLVDPHAESAALHAWLAAHGLPRPARVVSLRAALRGAVRIPRGADLDRICALLGVRWLEGEDAAARAAAMAACLSRARALRRLHEDGAERMSGDPERPAAGLPGAITAAQIAALPEAPGIYRFYDAEGALLYVGKAGNLRRRVASYFGRPSGRGRGHGARFLPRAHRLEHEPLGSELEALLKEARAIERSGPAGNVQVQVHERGRAYAAARRFAILLPRPSGRAVTAVFVRDGRFVGLAALGPRGGGLAAARRLLARAVYGRTGGRAAGPSDRDTEILQSWLARHGDSASRLDLDGFAKAADAGRALAAAARAVLAEPGAAVFR